MLLPVVITIDLVRVLYTEGEEGGPNTISVFFSVILRYYLDRSLNCPVGLAGHDFPYADAMAKESTMVRHWSVAAPARVKESTMVRHWSVQPPARGQRVNHGETLGWG